MNVSTAALSAGTTVLTTEVDGDDFGIPLVSVGRPSTKHVPPTRTVRQRARTGDGWVVWFTDGTKTRPVHGRTSWTRWNEARTLSTPIQEGTAR